MDANHSSSSTQAVGESSPEIELPESATDCQLRTLLTFDDGLAVGSRKNSERPVLHVLLNGCVVELAADQSLGVEHSVAGVHSDLVLGCISDQTLCVCESNVRRCGTVALIVGNNLHTVILPYADTTAEHAKR